jgi:hypothetical protein
MNCFEHIQKPAVGTCTNCGRGLCKECTTVIEGLLSCRGNCQNEIARKRQLLAKQERAFEERAVVYGTSGKIYQQAFASTALFGLLFVIGGAVLLYENAPIPGATLIGIGIICGIRSAGLGRAAKKYKTLTDNQTEQQTVKK